MTKPKAKRKPSGNLNVKNSNFRIEPVDENILISKDISKVITFYIFHTPLDKVAKQAIKLIDYGWNDPWNSKEALNRKMEKAFSNLGYIQLNANVDDMIDELKNASMDIKFPDDIYTERICINDCESNHYLSILRHIRNCFCHGRFQIIKSKGHPDVFVFEDVNNSDNVNARMIIRKTTLLSWIDIIKSGP